MNEATPGRMDTGEQFVATWQDDEEEAQAAIAENYARRLREFEEEQALRAAFRENGDAPPLNADAYREDRPKREVPLVPCACSDPNCPGERPDPKFETIGPEMLQPSVTPEGGGSSKGKRHDDYRPPTAAELREARRADEAYRFDYGTRRPG